ncbi:MAG: sensor hybrid histidine kinase [Pseudonocardiales bacterium]|nr:sensor hybrid histidine kinase [Pseudonocardiales bacterium]
MVAITVAVAGVIDVPNVWLHPEELKAVGNRRVAVLVVDDDENKRLAIRSVLAPLGFDIVEAESGSSALRSLLNQDFAVILLDVQMPIMGGFETAALIRLRQQSEMTPIIFITSLGADEITVDRYDQGAVDFLFAPVHPRELRAKVSFFVNLFVKADELAARARAVQASADKLRLLTEAAPIGIFQTDADNSYVYTNPHWSVISGVSAQGALGRSWADITSGIATVAGSRLDDIAGSRLDDIAGSRLDDSADSALDSTHRYEILVPGSLPRIVVVKATPLTTDDGIVSGWVGTLSDVTAEVRAEQVMAEAQVALEGVNVELAASARRDPLTGVGNRLALEEDLAGVEARATRYGHGYCLALIDIDHFKTFNDAYGHQAGDEGLRAVAAELKRQVRGGDSLYRYGGEEFLCLFPEQDREGALIALERIRAGVEQLAIVHTLNPFGVVTISCGVAVLDRDGTDSVRDVLREADQALYRAKQTGRNRVEMIHSSPTSIANAS